MDKLIVDGKVAVLVSGGYGAGWSTEGGFSCFDPVMAQAVLDGKSPEELQTLSEELYTDKYGGGAYQLSVQWVPEGTLFRIEEYDGAESLHTLDGYHWHKA